MTNGSDAETRKMDGRLKRVIAQAFGMRVEEVDDLASSATISAWDSVGQLELVMALEQEFGQEFSPEDIQVMDHVQAIRSLLLKKGAA